MSDQGPRFFLRVPVGYHEMSEDEQKDAAMEMWRDVMTQLGEVEDAEGLISARTAQDECPDDGHEL